MIIWLSILYMAVSISLHRDLLDSASKYRTHSYNDEAENPVIQHTGVIATQAGTQPQKWTQELELNNFVVG